jgi:uncharacterized protein (DUF1330 family)
LLGCCRDGTADRGSAEAVHASPKPFILPSSNTVPGSDTMRFPYTTSLAVLVGVALGALGSHVLRAQVPLPAFVVGEIDVENQPAYFKEYVPVAAKAVADGGGKYIVRNGKSVSLYGEPPKALAIMQFDSLAKAEAVFASKAYTDAKAIGDKYAKFRIYAVEGLQ